MEAQNSFEQNSPLNLTAHTKQSNLTYSSTGVRLLKSLCE